MAVTCANADLLPNLRLGALAQNLGGLRERYRGQLVSNRTLGLGASLALTRLQLGSDLEYSALHGLLSTHGASLFLSNAFEVGAGCVTRLWSARVWLRVFSLMLSLTRTRSGMFDVNVGGVARF